MCVSDAMCMCEQQHSTPIVFAPQKKKKKRRKMNKLYAEWREIVFFRSILSQFVEPFRLLLWASLLPFHFFFYFCITICFLFTICILYIITISIYYDFCVQNHFENRKIKQNQTMVIVENMWFYFYDCFALLCTALLWFFRRERKKDYERTRNKRIEECVIIMWVWESAWVCTNYTQQ